VVFGLAGKAPDSGVVSDCRQSARSFVSACEHVGEHTDGVCAGCWAWADRGGSCTGFAGAPGIDGKLAAQPLTISTIALSINTGSSENGFDGLCVSGVCIR